MTFTERRLRIFHTGDNNGRGRGNLEESNDDFFRLESLSSSNAYLSGTSVSLSATIIEECWTESNTLTAIRLLRISNPSFDNHPFLDPSYGREVSKLSFEGPCSSKTISKALETFPAIQTLELGPEFFLPEDFHDQDDLISSCPVIPPGKDFPRIKSLSMNCDVHKYLELEVLQQKQLDLRIISLLDLASEGMKTLTFCSLSLPNTPKIDSHLKTFIENSLRKGEKTVDYENKEIRYKMDSYPSNKGQLGGRKRKAESPTTVEMSQLLTKEVKTEHNFTLSTRASSDDERESSDEDDNEINPDFLQRHSSHSPVQDDNDRPSCRSIKTEDSDDTTTEEQRNSVINSLEAINQMTYRELQKELKSRGLASNGLKSVLVQRLLTSSMEGVGPRLGGGKVVERTYMRFPKKVTEYDWTETTPAPARTRETRDFPALGTDEVNRFLSDFAKVPENSVVLPFGGFTHLLSRKIKNRDGKFRRPLKWNYPSEPGEIEAIRDSVHGKRHVLIAIKFVSMFPLGHDDKYDQNHVVVCVVDTDEEKIRYFDSKLLKTKFTLKNSVEFKRLRFFQKLIYRTLGIYDIKPKREPKFKWETVYATEGHCSYGPVLLFCLLDQLWEGKEETMFPEISETRVKAGEVMKALELGTPNFLEEDEWQDWERQQWGGAGCC